MGTSTQSPPEIAEETGKPGTNFKQVTPREKSKLSPLMRHYGKMAHPFTACVRDNRKRFPAPGQAERVCAVLKDLIKGTTKWRNQEEAMAALLDAAGGNVGALEEMYRADLGRRLDFLIEQIGWEGFALVLIESAVRESALSSQARKALPAGSFVFPKERRYPIHDLAHARNALARASGKPEEAKVKAAVYAKYPALKDRSQEELREGIVELAALYAECPGPPNGLTTLIDWATGLTAGEAPFRLSEAARGRLSEALVPAGLPGAMTWGQGGASFPAGRGLRFDEARVRRDRLGRFAQKIASLSVGFATQVVPGVLAHRDTFDRLTVYSPTGSAQFPTPEAAAAAVDRMVADPSVPVREGDVLQEVTLALRRGSRKINRVGAGHETGGQFSKAPIAAIGRSLARAAGVIPEDRAAARTARREKRDLKRTRKLAPQARQDRAQQAMAQRMRARRREKPIGRVAKPKPTVTLRKPPTPSERTRLEKGELPERGDFYFNTDKADLESRYGTVDLQAIPLEKITPVRARPEGIANAEPHMGRAARGEGDKRDPITVVRQPDGGFKVYDGNSTFAIASKHGWKSIPAIVVDSPEDGDRIEQIAKRAKATRKRAAKVKAEKAKAKTERTGRMASIDAEIASMIPVEDTAPTRQEFDTFDEMYASAEATNDELTALLDSVAGAVDGAEASMGPLKTRENAQGKIIRKRYDERFGEGRGHNGLKDITRGTLLVESFQDMPDLYDEIRRQAEDKGWKIVEAENRISEPTGAGYADIQLGLQTPSGTVAELQISTHVLNQAKQGPGHKMFEATREIEKQAVQAGHVKPDGKADVSKLEPRVRERYEKLMARQRGLYGGAVTKSYGLDPSATKATASEILRGPQASLYNRVQTGQLDRKQAMKVARSKGYQAVIDKLEGKAVGPTYRRTAPTPRGAEGSQGPWVDVGGDVEKAARLLGEGKRVRLNQPREASVLIKRLAEIVADAKSRGEQAPAYDLCNITVPGTNLFCVKSKGIPRLKMPQLSGRPRPGSKAAKLPKDERGRVDLTEQFKQHLVDRGHKIEEAAEKASRLRASQNQLNGAKVAAMAGVLDEGGKLGGDPRIFVSRENYIVDGHHRWAANVAHDLGDDRLGDVEMPVRRVDMSIIELLAESNDFAADWGIPQADVSAPSGGRRQKVREAAILAEIARRAKDRGCATCN